MKLSTALLSLWSATAVSAKFFGGSADQAILDDAPFKVPGENPLEFCEDPKNYRVEVGSVDLSPNPPVPGEKLYINATGTVFEDIEEGSYVQLQVKWNRYVTLINTKADFCENVSKIDLKCPLKKGDLTVHKEADIPKAVPPGRYDVFASVKTAKDEEIVCMKGFVQFHAS